LNYVSIHGIWNWIWCQQTLVRVNGRVSRYLENFFGEHYSAELQNTAILGTAPILRGGLTQKYG
jgi:hypothetical protein